MESNEKIVQRNEKQQQQKKKQNKKKLQHIRYCKIKKANSHKDFISYNYLINFSKKAATILRAF